MHPGYRSQHPFTSACVSCRAWRLSAPLCPPGARALLPARPVTRRPGPPSSPLLVCCRFAGPSPCSSGRGSVRVTACSCSCSCRSPSNSRCRNSGSSHACLVAKQGARGRSQGPGSQGLEVQRANSHRPALVAGRSTGTPAGRARGLYPHRALALVGEREACTHNSQAVARDTCLAALREAGHPAAACRVAARQAAAHRALGCWEEAH
mmetsp:Transcript_58035/g.186454  ORF Transcript_58035/g.186454 Transcript_58035/m.186454 type:complete len:208 (-) Transcript_58035:144-767(-)